MFFYRAICINHSTSFKLRKFFFFCCALSGFRFVWLGWCDDHFGQPHKSHYSNPFMNWKALTNGAFFFAQDFVFVTAGMGDCGGFVSFFLLFSAANWQQCINFQFRREVEQTKQRWFEVLHIVGCWKCVKIRLFWNQMIFILRISSTDKSNRVLRYRFSRNSRPLLSLHLW